MSTIDDSGAIPLHHFITVILIVAPLGAILLPIIGTLIFFTPSESRRRPVFILNILACLLGICQAIYFVSLYSHVVLHPDKPISHSTALAAIATLLTPPILIDAILFFRLLAFYPIQLTPRNMLIVILTPTFLFKAARLACLIAFLVTYPVTRFDGPGYDALPGLVWGRGPWVIALLALQAVDNSYLSTMFLYKLYRFRYSARKAIGGSKKDIFSRVPAVFVIALGNYLIPVGIDVIVIVLMVLLPSWSNGAYLLFLANFITILGIVFATVWTTNQNWIIRKMVEAGVDARTQSTMRFQTKSISEAVSEFDPFDSPEFLFRTP
ncbi:hypothetical protein F5148DRAFT_901752 [Russula earlei]|uniref:Uncharacterized protein n=1 Tax=Russula earlei TaxID=71964 RepID=A0ACC0UL83_9AGAM|nr:hypothetical protein F5148DRAFT_901752 [Russula earlei]